MPSFPLTSKPRLVMGIVHAKFPLHSAGHQCATLHWLLGFRELGWDVWIVEELPSKDCKARNGAACNPADSVNVAAWQEFCRMFDFEGRESLFVDGVPSNAAEFKEFADGAELFLNYSGQFSRLEWVERTQCKVYLDVDPGYTQAWAMGYGCNMNFAGHDKHVTIGALMGSPQCKIPATGFEWTTTLPPVACSLYSGAKNSPPAQPATPWTTITHWYGIDEVVCNGVVLKPKRDTFLEMIEIGELAKRPILLASDVEPQWDDYGQFTARGWTFCASREVCESIGSYLAFVSDSFGEFSICKGGYVATRSGWLSDRSMAYLACGRPVVALDTGWSEILPPSTGLLGFSDSQGAVARMEAVEANYAACCAAALELAREVFSAAVILPKLLATLGV